MKHLLLLAAAMAVTSIAYGQTLCSDCPDPASLSCQLWPAVCEQCLEDCIAAPPIRRISPVNTAPYDPYLVSYMLPKTIGVIQLAHEQPTGWPQNPSYMTNYQLAEEVASYGFGALKVWMESNPFEGMGPWCWKTYWGVELCGDYNDTTSEMYEFWAKSPIDTIFVRPQFYGWTHWGMNECIGTVGPQMALADYYGIAKRLYSEFGYRNMTVILTDWEQDWIICDGYKDFLVQIINQRQSDVERARKEAFLELGYRPNLRVMHAVVVNRYPDNTTDPELPRLAEIIPTLEHKPDLIGLSYWRKGYDPIETLDWLQETTGYPRYRIYIDELGTGNVDLQAQRYRDYVTAFWDWGVRVVNIWLWKQTWCEYGGKQYGMWYQQQPCDGKVEFLGQTPGLEVLQDLMGVYHE